MSAGILDPLKEPTLVGHISPAAGDYNTTLI